MTLIGYMFPQFQFGLTHLVCSAIPDGNFHWFLDTFKVARALLELLVDSPVAGLGKALELQSLLLLVLQVHPGKWPLFQLEQRCCVFCPGQRVLPLSAPLATGPPDAGPALPGWAQNKTDREKEEEFLVQNTPPTPESPSTVAVIEYSNHPSTVTVSGSLPPNQEIQSITSETDGTAEAQNTAGQMQDLKSEQNISSKGFDASVSSSSGNQSEPEHAENGKGKVFRGQKNLQDAQGRDSSSKKQKTSIKTSVNIKKKNKSRKCGERGERESDLKEHNNRLPKGCKWSFQVSDLQNLSSTERITVLQTKMQEIRKRYLLLKAELAAIDRTKRLKKKKEQEIIDMFPVALPVCLLSDFYLGLGIYFKSVRKTINGMSRFSEAATCIAAENVLVCLLEHPVHLEPAALGWKHSPTICHELIQTVLEKDEAPEHLQYFDDIVWGNTAKKAFEKGEKIIQILLKARCAIKQSKLKQSAQEIQLLEVKWQEGCHQIPMDVVNKQAAVSPPTPHQPARSKHRFFYPLQVSGGFMLQITVKL
ncbi:hypothetical protein HGM15179_016286 [Zosterops borbonicus]|uniref:Uncharacterized protein n=1 Tax=Zosterops borbonicus TaxID=364589 RepID=A0A8K1LEG1_9PASS|nr:hypothetical protein HGM15179_016286 [Zosterops borbonicus]